MTGEAPSEVESFAAFATTLVGGLRTPALASALPWPPEEKYAKTPAAVANTSCVLSGDQSGCVPFTAPSGRSAIFAPVTRSTLHSLPPQAATTVESSGEIVANPWPPVFATALTSGLGGAVLVTSIIHKLLPDAALTGAAMYFPSRETTWQAPRWDFRAFC